MLDYFFVKLENVRIFLDMFDLMDEVKVKIVYENVEKLLYL